MKIRSTRTDKTIQSNITTKLTKLLRRIYTRIGIKSRYTMTDDGAEVQPDLDVLEFIDGDTNK